MLTTPEDLAAAIASRGLPDAVARIATDGGAAVHPELEFRAEDVDLSPDGPAASIVGERGDEGWLPLWQSSTEITFSLPDGTFCLLSAESDEYREEWADFAGAVRYLLTDLYEDEVDEGDLAEIAALLLPEDQRAGALVREER